MCMSAHHHGCTAINIPTKSNFLCRCFSVHINQNQIRFFFDFSKQLIDNTPPKVTLKVDSSKKGKLSLLLSVQDEVSGVADAIYKIEGQEAYAFGPLKDVGQTNIVDSHSATLVAQDIALPAGVSGKKVTIQVYDRAGNCSKKSINLP